MRTMQFRRLSTAVALLDGWFMWTVSGDVSLSRLVYAAITSVLLGCAKQDPRGVGDMPGGLPTGREGRLEDQRRPLARFGIPFSRAELVRAEVLGGSSPDDAVRSVSTLLETAESSLGVTIMDVTLLVLAAISEDVAARVIQYRPELHEQVQAVRRNPSRFLQGLRRNEQP
jgi:hypothetical protein